MSYETYTTEALVCGTKNRNTADRSYLLFTKDAGMLFADARSVREERSRQRYALQDLSLLRVSLVKGKAGWKIGSIEPVQNFYHEASGKAARGSVVSVVRLLRRFLHGEVADATLFGYVINALQTLAGEMSKRQFVELVTKVHVLGYLGYVDVKMIPSKLYEVAPRDLALQYDETCLPILDKLYTHALSVSHL